MSYNLRVKNPTKIIELSLQNNIVGGVDITKSPHLIEWEIKRSIGGDSLSLFTNSLGDQELAFSSNKNYFIQLHASVDSGNVTGGNGTFKMEFYRSDTNTKLGESDNAYPVIYNNRSGLNVTDRIEERVVVGHLLLEKPTYPVQVYIEPNDPSSVTVLTGTHLVILEM